MKIAIVSPLYPPDIAEPAPYVKELSARLSNNHEITVVTYAHIPESIPNVKIVTTSKWRPLPIRLALYTLLLLRVTSNSDVLYVESGSSVSLPVVIARLFRRTPLVVHFFEDEAWERARESGLTRKSLKDFSAHPEGTFKIRFIALLQGILLRSSNTTVASTSDLAESLIQNYRVQNSVIKVLANPLPRPEILPFSPFPKGDFDKYEISWNEHILALERMLEHAKQR